MDVAGSITNYSMHQRTYRYSPVAGAVATFPFGFGLGYSPFVYESVTWTLLSTPVSVATTMPQTPTIGACDAIQLNVTVRNAGNFDGDEVMFLLQLTHNCKNLHNSNVTSMGCACFADRLCNCT